MRNIAISARNISKMYKVPKNQTERNHKKHTKIHKLSDGGNAKFIQKHTLKQFITTEHDFYEFWALKSINFDIEKGEAVGIIGRNGAGKSTLLKILSRITKPTTGRFEVNGRVSSLLEVGTGFHSELTGRENIFLNGTILGMTKKEIVRKYDEIIDFSGVEAFINTPIKHYSSGMKVRLAFSVAAHLDPEILIIDEVLAVGDAEFQKKCLGKMEDVTKQGRTILFVSHNMGSIRNLCSKGVLLENGIISFEGSPDQTINKYLGENLAVPIFIGKSTKYCNIMKICIKSRNGSIQNNFPVGSDWCIEVIIEASQKVKHFVAGIGIQSASECSVFTIYSKPLDLNPGKYVIQYENTEIILSSGLYRLFVGISSRERPIQYVDELVLNIEETIDKAKFYRTSGVGLIIPKSTLELHLLSK